jgi:hypothetical protein
MNTWMNHFPVEQSNQMIERFSFDRMRGTILNQQASKIDHPIALFDLLVIGLKNYCAETGTFKICMFFEQFCEYYLEVVAKETIC